MKQLLLRLSAGLLLTLATTLNLPAVSQPASPSAPASNGGQVNNPLLRGVNLTSQQKNQLMSIQREENEQVVQLLTPTQKKIASTQGPRAVKFTKPQEQKLKLIAQKNAPRYKAVFTPEQIKQIQANAQALQGANGKAPGQK